VDIASGQRWTTPVRFAVALALTIGCSSSKAEEPFCARGTIAPLTPAIPAACVDATARCGPDCSEVIMEAVDCARTCSRAVFVGCRERGVRLPLASCTVRADTGEIYFFGYSTRPPVEGRDCTEEESHVRVAATCSE